MVYFCLDYWQLNDHLTWLSELLDSWCIITVDVAPVRARCIYNKTLSLLLLNDPQNGKKWYILEQKHLYHINNIKSGRTISIFYLIVAKR